MAETPWWDPEADNWPDYIEWWTDPRLAYAAGLLHGADIERKRAARDATEQTLRALLRARKGGDG